MCRLVDTWEACSRIHTTCQSCSVVGSVQGGTLGREGGVRGRRVYREWKGRMEAGEARWQELQEGRSSYLL